MEGVLLCRCIHRDCLIVSLEMIQRGVGSWRLNEENVTKQLWLHNWVHLDVSLILLLPLLHRTPLHYAAANGSYQCAVTLVTAGAGVNEADCKGCSPLHYAAASDTYRR